MLIDFMVLQLLVICLVYHSLENNKQDKVSSAYFLENWYKKIKQTSNTIIFDKNRRGLTLKIVNRKK